MPKSGCSGNGVCPKAVAADINPEPLERGRQTVNEAQLGDIISMRLSNGLKQINSDEADDIVIAGMGGELIADIILSCDFSRDSEKHFILQPMTKSEELIRLLCENGFAALLRENAILFYLLHIQDSPTARMSFFIIRASLTPKTSCTAAFCEVTPKGSEKKRSATVVTASLRTGLKIY